MTFLEFWDKTGQDRFVFERKFWFSKFDLFWTELDLTLGQIWKWVSPSNSIFQITHKICVARRSCYIFVRWPHLAWLWFWPFFSISLLFAWHLRHPFNSILTNFGLAAIPGLVSAANKAEKSYFDLTLTQHLTSLGHSMTFWQFFSEMYTLISLFVQIWVMGLSWALISTVTVSTLCDLRFLSEL